MRHYWLVLSDRFDALKPRERWIVFATLIVCLFGLVYFLFLDPALTRRNLYQQQISKNQSLASELQNQEQALVQLSLQDPDQEKRKQINTILATNQATRIELSSFQMQLAPPEKMPRLLADLLARQPGLVLLGVKTLKTENLLADKTEETTAETSSSNPQTHATIPGVYRHGLEISVRGDYAALAAYARKVEQLPWKFYWGDLQLNVDEYPHSIMTFTVYTMSLDQAWLSL